MINNNQEFRLKRLERANTNLTEFARIAAHELREPIRTISSFSELIYESESLPEATYREYLEYIINGAERMNSLVSALLRYSTASMKSLEYESMDCNELVEAVIADLHQLIIEKNATVTYDHLPRITATHLFQQVFQNLIANAIKFVPPDRQPVVHVGVKDSGEFWLFSVSDNGIGIELEYHDKVFEIFRRLNSRSDFPGDGIGLSICRQVVENHGGSICLESKGEDRGTTFYFTIPKEASDAQKS